MKTYLLRDSKPVEPQKPAQPQRSKPAASEPKAVTKNRPAPTSLAGVSSRGSQPKNKFASNNTARQRMVQGSGKEKTR